MSKENVDLIRNLYDGFAKGDVPAVLAGFDPEIVWNEAENFPYADGNPYCGPDAVLQGVFMRLGSHHACPTSRSVRRGHQGAKDDRYMPPGQGPSFRRPAPTRMAAGSPRRSHSAPCPTRDKVHSTRSSAACERCHDGLNNRALLHLPLRLNNQTGSTSAATILLFGIFRDLLTNFL